MAKQNKWYQHWFVRWPIILLAVFLVLDYIVLPVGMGVYVNIASKSVSCCKTPKDYGLKYDLVRLTNTDGSALAGWFVPGQNEKTVILMHGASSTKVNLLEHAAFLHDAGYNTFLLDAHGHGDSGGKNMEYGWNAANDVGTVIDWLQKQPDVHDEKIALLGLSMGAEGALSAAAADLRVQVVVAEGAGVHAFGEARALSGDSWLSYPFDWLMFKTMDLFSDDPAPIAIPDAMKMIQPRKVLLISSENANERKLNPLYARLGGKTTSYWALDDTPHIGGLSKHPGDYKKKIITFYNAALE